MAEDYRKIQREVFSSNFVKFCKKNIVKDLISLEKQRIYYILAVVLLWILDIIVLAGTIYFATENGLKLDGDIFSLIIAVAVSLHFLIVKNYKNKAKKIVLPKLISYLGKFEIIEDKYQKSIFQNYLKSLNLISDFNNYHDDDYLVGTYKDVKLDVIEVDLSKKSGKNSVKIFKGLFVKFKSFKKFQGYTVIKRESLKIGNSKEQVVLEDPVFEKYFDVTATDQIEARYLLTPAFMNRLVQLNKKNIGKNLTMSFEHGNVNIAVSSSKDWFEVPLLKPVTEISNYRAIVLDLLSILSIIDVLKLDQKIGM